MRDTFTAERARLDANLKALMAKLEQRAYAEAQGLANSLRWEYTTTCKLDESNDEKSRWNDKQKEVSALIQQRQADEAAQQLAAVQREDEVRRTAEAQQAEERRAAAEKELAGKLASQIKASAALRKAATGKDW